MLIYHCPYGFEPHQGRMHTIPLSRRVQEGKVWPFRDTVPQEGLGQTQLADRQFINKIIKGRPLRNTFYGCEESRGRIHQH